MKYQERIKLPPMQQRALERAFDSCRHDCETCELRSACDTLYARFVFHNTVDPTSEPERPSLGYLPEFSFPFGRKVAHKIGS